MNSKINQFIKTNPTFFQIAKDNKWEECWIIDLSGQLPNKDKIEKYLSKEKYKYLAVEYQWDQPEGAYVFNIGHSPDMKISSQLDFLSTLLSFARDIDSFKSLIDQIDDEVIGKKYLFKQELDFIRVSIFNHWFSSDPVDIWKSGEPREMGKKKLEKMFEDHKNLLESDLNFQAMAFMYSYDFEDMDFGVRYILKVPSAKRVNETWSIDFDLMLNYLLEIEEFSLKT